MKYYIIMNKHGKYLGFTNDPEVYKGFIKQRGKYPSLQLNESQLNENLKQQIFDQQGEITTYTTKNGNKIYLFDYEEVEIVDMLGEIQSLIHYSVFSFLKLLKYVKFSKVEEKIIFDAFEKINSLLTDLSDEECCIEFEEYLDLEKIYTVNLSILAKKYGY